jgi:hypothetical protein
MDTGKRRLPGEGRWLMAGWRANPTAAATVRLCDWVSAHNGRVTLPKEAVDEITNHVILRHPDDVHALLALGRFILAHGNLQAALGIMVHAANLAREAFPAAEEPAPLVEIGYEESPSRIRTTFAILDDPESWDPERLAG